LDRVVVCGDGVHIEEIGFELEDYIKEEFVAGVVCMLH